MQPAIRGESRGGTHPTFGIYLTNGLACKARLTVGSEGRTPEQRRCGKQWRRTSLLFGEHCFFKRAQTKAIQGADDRMTRGVYIGHHERTGAVLLLTPEGVRRGTGITQLPADQKFNSEFLPHMLDPLFVALFSDRFVFFSLGKPYSGETLY